MRPYPNLGPGAEDLIAQPPGHPVNTLQTTIFQETVFFQKTSMASKPSTVLLITLLLLTQLHQTTSLITLLLYNLPTLFSLPHITHSLLTRVSSLRSSRGDARGARRAHLLADKVKLILGRRFRQTVLSMGWTYVKHYGYGSRGIGSLSYRNFVDYYETVRGWVTELARLRDDVERIAWIERNYKDINGVFKSIFTRFLSVLITSEPLKKLLEEEMEEGDLLKDCLEVGGKELKGLFQVLKDLTSQFNTTTDEQQGQEL